MLIQAAPSPHPLTVDPSPTRAGYRNIVIDPQWLKDLNVINKYIHKCEEKKNSGRYLYDGGKREDF